MRAAILLLVALAVPALSQIKREQDPASAISGTAISPSTVTVSGTGSKCLSVDDPTLVVDCGNDRVGVGTASPATKLHMSSGTLTVDGTSPLVKINDASGGQHFVHDLLNGRTAGLGVNVGGAQYAASIYVDGTARMSIATDGGVGIGGSYATSPNPPTNGLAVAGNVGINTLFPATPLDVNGSAQFGSGATKSTFTAAGFFRAPSLSIATLQGTTPGAVGEVAYCNDCTPVKMVVSTGTSAGNWADAVGGGFK